MRLFKYHSALPLNRLIRHYPLFRYFWFFMEYLIVQIIAIPDNICVLYSFVNFLYIIRTFSKRIQDHYPAKNMKASDTIANSKCAKSLSFMEVVWVDCSFPFALAPQIGSSIKLRWHLLQFLFLFFLYLFQVWNLPTFRTYWIRKIESYVLGFDISYDIWNISSCYKWKIPQ